MNFEHEGDETRFPPIVHGMSDLHRIILGSSENALELAPDLVGKVALVVTSPPYHNAIDYEAHAEDTSKNYRTRSSIDYPDEYLPLMAHVWSVCWKMLRPGGFLIINAGTVLHDGYHYPLPQDLVSQEIEDSGKWDFIRTVVWFKVTAGVKRAGSVIQHPWPDYWSYNMMTEHIQVLRKPGGTSILNDDVPIEWWEPIWDLAPVPPGQVEHPAPFPEDIPHRFIRMLTNQGDWVMDPFNGSGATTKAAADLDRIAIGFDISPKYVELATRRIVASSAVRARQLRISPVERINFSAGPSRGTTRHGAGLAGRKRKSK